MNIRDPQAFAGGTLISVELGGSSGLAEIAAAVADAVERPTTARRVS